jgi:porin
VRVNRICLLSSAILAAGNSLAVAAQWAPQASIIIDNSQVLAGGVKRDLSSRALASVGLQMQHAAHQLVISYQALRGSNGSDSVGDLQAYSNIDETGFSRLAEAYYRYDGGRWSVTLGKTDANSDFAGPAASGGFINSSMGFSPTIVTLPTYPKPALSVSANIALNDSASFAVGTFAADGASSFKEQFNIAELRLRLNAANRLSIGAWHDSNPVATNAGTTAARGIFATVDSVIPARDWLAGGIAVYGQLGYTEAEFSDIAWHLGGGVTMNALLRGDDVLGAGISHIRLSEARLRDAGNETALELYYQWPITNHMSLKPDLQWIIDPSGRRDIGDTLVFTLRLEAAL